MDTKNKSNERKKKRNTTMPDEERRKILKKLATCAFVAPMAMVLLEGGDNLTYAGRSGRGRNPSQTGVSYKPVDKNS
jgi:hypothetical protein